MADDDVTNSLLNEYSIAEVLTENADASEIYVEEIHRESLRDAFSRYAKVVFHDIADSYPTDADVQCFFSLTLDIKHKEGDVVGLFRLGWRSPSEMITFQVVPKPVNEDQRDFQVQFRAADLPKDEGEIYQLCYISDNEVWGASVPFEFRRATAEELLVVDSGDIVIVRSQSAVAEDLKCQLANMRKELIAAEASNVEVGKKLIESQEENKLLKARLKDLEKVEQVLERLRADNQALDKARNDSEDTLRQAELRIITLNSVISSLQTDMDNLQRQVTTQSEEIARQNNLASCANSQRDCTLDLIDALREAKELAIREMRVALADNEKMQLELTKAADERSELRKQINDSSKKYDDVLLTLDVSKAAHKKRIEDLLVQLTQVTSESQQRVNESKAESEVLHKKITTLETQLEHKQNIIKTLRAQVDSDSSLHPEAPPKNQKNKDTQDELTMLQKRRDDVQSRYSEVCKAIHLLRTDMDTLQQTEDSLVESQKRLTARVKCLQNIVAEAEGCGNVLEASLHQRELGVSHSKLQEKTVCIESAHQRRDELENQLKELEQEKSVLTQQIKETTISLRKVFHHSCENADEEFSFVDIANQVEAEEVQLPNRFHHTTEAGNGQVELEVADLRERLRQAAEAYKILYQEKLQTEKQLAQLQAEKELLQLQGLERQHQGDVEP